MAEHSDIQLLHDFSNGDPKAFRSIYDLFFPRLFAFAMSLTRSKPDAEEIVLDVLTVLFRKNKDFGSIQNIRAFLYISTKNACYNYIKRKQRKLLNSVELLKDIPDDDDLEIHQIEGEMLNAIYEAVNTLPDRCKTIMEMMYVDGLEPETISNKLNISVQTVYSQKSRAVTLLKRTLGMKAHSLATSIILLLILQICFSFFSMLFFL